MATRHLVAVWAMLGVAGFHLAYELPSLRGLAALSCAGAWAIATRLSPKSALSSGLVYGFFLFAPQLHWMFGLFSVFAVALWLFAAAWIGGFCNLISLCRRLPGLQRLSTPWLLVPAGSLAWTGMEVARCELNPLRFTWFSTGFLLGPNWSLPWLGVYGIGCVSMVIGASAVSLSDQRRRSVWIAIPLLLALPVLGAMPNAARPVASEAAGERVRFVALQLEFKPAWEVLQELERARETHPGTSLFVLGEYTFQGEIPSRVLKWVDSNDVYLVAGGVDESDGDRFNTAFVCGPDGTIVFKQAKAQPIQFFDDGLPAREQRCWDSPWGRIGLAICYDLSYARFIDTLIAQGAQALIIPTMDVTSWGQRQHEQHARIAPIRAAEYGVPILRVCTSGISQHVDAAGAVLASAPFPGQRELLVGDLALAATGLVPALRRLAWCLGYTFFAAAIVVWSIALVRRERTRCGRIRAGPADPPPDKKRVARVEP